jgi:hypothetical protein
LAEGVSKPAEEDPGVEVDIVKANLVKQRSIEEDLLVFLPIENSKPDNRQEGEHNVEHVVAVKVIDSLGTEVILKPIDPHRPHKENVLIEHVRDEVSVPAVCFTTVSEK